MRLNVSFNLSRRVVFISFLGILLLLLMGVAFFSLNNQNPIPKDIASQLKYKAIYPSDTHSIDNGSYKYHADNKTLSFNVNKNGKSIVFTEQPAPTNLGTGKQVYYPAIGIHPYAQFDIKLGTVALTKFWQTGNFKPIGQSAVLASNGTLVIANSQNDLTNADWKELFESLKISK